MTEVYVVIGEGFGENEIRVMGVYNEEKLAKQDLAKLKKVSYGDWEDFRIEVYNLNKPDFSECLEELLKQD